MEILSQCAESTLKDFKPSSMNHGKGSVLGQLTPVEQKMETVIIDEPAGGYVKMMEYRNLARGHQIASENKGAYGVLSMKKFQITTKKQKTYGKPRRRCTWKQWTNS